MVPSLVLIGIVDDQHLALLPMANPITNADSQPLRLLGHEQAEMQAQQNALRFGADIGVGLFDFCFP